MSSWPSRVKNRILNGNHQRIVLLYAGNICWDKTHNERRHHARSNIIPIYIQIGFLYRIWSGCAYRNAGATIRVKVCCGQRRNYRYVRKIGRHMNIVGRCRNCKIIGFDKTRVCYFVVCKPISHSVFPIVILRIVLRICRNRTLRIGFVYPLQRVVHTRENDLFCGLYWGRIALPLFLKRCR